MTPASGWFRPPALALTESGTSGGGVICTGGGGVPLGFEEGGGGHGMREEE